MEMTKANLKKFRADFTKAVEALEKSYGVKLELGAISYSENNFTTRLTVTNGGDNSEIEKTKFECAIVNFSMYGLTKADYRKEFKATDGKTYRLVGVKPRARKNPFVIETVGGTRYVCAPEFLGLKMDFKGWTVTEHKADGSTNTITL